MKTIGIILIIACTMAPRSQKDQPAPGPGMLNSRNILAGMLEVPAGRYRPFMHEKGQPAVVKVHPFYLDVSAVTNADFLEFVKANPVWARSKVSRLFADAGYLKQWAGDWEIGDDKIKHSPVINVSWFAANAYALWKGKRLPSLTEWEYAAAAPPLGMKKGQQLTRIILGWYDHPNPATLPQVRSTYKNTYGLYDMHGLIWEWVEDFNSVVGQGDNGGINNFSCGAGSINSINKEDYAAFMRFAFRGGLQARYTVSSLGFRCAKDDEGFKLN